MFVCVCSLGALHDGFLNDCNSTNQHVMASAPQRLTNVTFNNPFVFSRCSVQYFRDQITQLTAYVHASLYIAVFKVQ